MKKKNALKMAVQAGALVLSTTVCMTVDVSSVFACDGPPPAPRCNATVVCSLAVNETFVAGGNNVQGNVGAAVHLTVTGNDARCKYQTGQAKVELSAECYNPFETNVAALPGAGTINKAVAQGLNKVNVPVTFQGGSERFCFVKGQATVVLPSGQSFVAACKQQNACIGSPSPIDSTKPAVSLAVQGEGIKTTPPGAAQTTIYRVQNNTNDVLAGTMTLTQKNAVTDVQAGNLPAPNPDPAVVCPANPPTGDSEKDCSEAPIASVCGCDNVTYANTCELEKYGVAKLDDKACPPPHVTASPYMLSHPGGDVMPVQILEANEDQCIPLPENPSLASDTTVTRALPSILPGASTDYRIVRRPWALCADGSCSVSSLYLITSSVTTGESYIACAGGPIVVDQGTPDESNCMDSGQPPTTTPYTTPDIDNDGLDDSTEITIGTDPMLPDSDNDGINDSTEVSIGTNPTTNDSDGDGLSDGDEVNIHHTNPSTNDSDGDGINDDVEISQGTNPNVVDTDGDGLSDAQEVQLGTNPTLRDTDGDGVNDSDEVTLNLNPNNVDSDGDGVNDGIEVRLNLDPLDNTNPADTTIYLDTDGDGLTDSEEATLNLNPNVKDSDGDGLDDGMELVYGTDPNVKDSDGDGINDGDEVNVHLTNPARLDSDGDGLSDFDEINQFKTDPFVADTDGDGLSDGLEIEVHKTDPLRSDTDGQGANDGEELRNGYNPNDPTDDAQLIGSRNSQVGIVLEAKDANMSTVLFKEKTAITGLDILRKYVLVQSLSNQISRISERLEVDATNVTEGQTLSVSINYDSFLNKKDSPFKINKLQFGTKQQNAMHDGKNVTGIGAIEIDSAPYTIMDFMYQSSVWVTNPTTKNFERLKISNFTINLEGDRFVVGYDIIAPAFVFDEIYVMHDVNGFERTKAEEACDDKMDEDGDGDIDCADSDCSRDPVCNQPVVEICGNGIDDDSNGKTDCDDPRCAFGAECQTPKESCTNGKDDDGDGDVDCDDSDCSGLALCEDGGGNNNQPPTTKSNDEEEGCATTGTSGAPSSPATLFLAILAGLVGFFRRKQD